MESENHLLIELFRQMLLIRRFEEKVKELYMQGKIKGMLHLCIGQEAVAVGVVSVLQVGEYIVSTHRGHGHFIAKGADIRLMMAELFGKKTGYCKGKGGSMHIADIDLGHLGANGIVGESLPIATGAALAFKNIRQTSQIVVCFFGDGALNMGVFHESLNLAGLWKLPVVYICENNLYALSTHVKRACAIENVAKRAESYGMPGVTVDGMDVLAVRNEAEAAVKRARDGKGPSLLICQTYRFLGHGRNPDCRLYRTKEEEEKWKITCPIKIFRNSLLNKNILSENDLGNIENKITQEIDSAVKFAEESPDPVSEDLEADIYAPNNV
ncbi:MAG: thiamine pyrophosphate-dependent dehydrogenase E1 component subunit alpha [Candidatus Omnitrophota bacterium]